MFKQSNPSTERDHTEKSQATEPATGDCLFQGSTQEP